MKRNKILVFGDSITYGQRDLEMGGWTNRLKLALANDSSITSCHVFNMGISGQTTAEILERMDRECMGRILEDANNIIVIAAGINDTQEYGGEFLVDEQTFRENVKALIAKAKAHTSKVIYLGLTPVDETRTNPVWWDKVQCWKSERVVRYDEIIDEECRLGGARYVYVYDQIDAATNEDGLHPAAEGHAVIAEIMLNVICEYVQKESPLSKSAIHKSGGLGSSLKNFFESLFG